MFSLCGHISNSCSFACEHFLPGIPSHFSFFDMHTSNNTNYKYVSLWYINFSQDVIQFSKEAFWLYTTLFFFPSLCVCTHSPTWLHVLSRTPPTTLLLWRLPQVSQIELVALSRQLRSLIYPLIITPPLYSPTHTIRLWAPQRQVLWNCCLHNNIAGRCCVFLID